MQNVDISSDCTADVIVRKEKDVFDSHSVHVPLTKLVSVGTDGASFMTLLKRGIHCFAYKLAPCNSQAAEECDRYECCKTDTDRSIKLLLLKIC